MSNERPFNQSAEGEPSHRHSSRYDRDETATSTDAGSSNLVSPIDSCDLRIRTLTTILNNMHQADRPTRALIDIPELLRYIAILLNRGTTRDKDAKNVVAVTSTTEESSLKLLIVAQNSQNVSQNDIEPFKMDITVVERNSRTLEEIFNSTGTSQSLEEYIADLLQLFNSVDPDNLEDVLKFRTFVTISCINKLESRLNSGKTRWSPTLPDTLLSWKPIEGEEIERFWVTEPKWSLKFDDVFEGDMKTRVVNGNVEWEFSFDTAHQWSSILGILLKCINKQITEYGNTPAELRKRPMEHEGIRGLMVAIAHFYSSLFLFVKIYNRVVKALLGIPSLASLIRTAMKGPTDLINEAEDDEDVVELLPDCKESPEDVVYRHLESFVSCALALHMLLNPDLLKNFQAISASVVFFSGFSSDVMSTEDVVSGLLERYPNAENILQTSMPYLESKIPSSFHGAIHAEAALMGLAFYFAPYYEPNGRDAEIVSNLDNSNLESFYVPFTANTFIFQDLSGLGIPTIATGKKCCWCCNKLSQLANPVVLLPESHGVIQPWCPPRVGIDLRVLEALETQLWEKLYNALKEKHRSVRRSESESLSLQSSSARVEFDR